MCVEWARRLLLLHRRSSPIFAVRYGKSREIEIDAIADLLVVIGARRDDILVICRSDDSRVHRIGLCRLCWSLSLERSLECEHAI